MGAEVVIRCGSFSAACEAGRHRTFVPTVFCLLNPNF